MLVSTPSNYVICLACNINKESRQSSDLCYGFLFIQVDTALAPGYAEDPLVEGFRVTLKRSDLATLSNLNWLNDEVHTVCAAVM